ncbi:universal stress protein [Streptomyces sp. 1222.5]|uniref:universal stress protein n=1 Tax=Streptomyces sp. 1222.5 TaxID=1881026 RepID=UPI003EBB85B3
MKNTRNDQPGRVIVGIEDREGSVAALKCAAEEARQRHAVLVVVAAWSPYGGVTAARTCPSPELDAAQRASTQVVLNTICQRADLPDDLSVERRVERGRLGPVLAGLAHSPRDLLVVGLRHRSAFAWLRASFDSYCLRSATAPVLVVPPDWASTVAEPVLAA